MNNQDLSQRKFVSNILLAVPMNWHSIRLANSVSPLNDTGLGYIASACQQEGVKVTLFSWNADYSMKEFKEKLLEIRPEIFGLKVFTPLFREACETLRCVRETLPKTITIIGGPHPSTSRPKDISIEFNGLIDYAIAGDGELGISKLIQKIDSANGKPEAETLSDVPGLIYFDEDKVCKNEPLLDVDLDKLAPMDWSLQRPEWFGVNHGLDNSSIGALIMDSRGCPARCDYCLSHKINGSKPRHRSLKSLCAEIEELVYKYKVQALVFTGNVFLSDLDRVRKLCEWLIKKNFPLKWSFTGAAYERRLIDSDLLALLQRAGCTLIYYGIESGSPNVRKRLHQPIELEEYREIVKRTVQAGISAGGYFMFGFPDETVQEMNETVKFALSLPFNPLSFAICLPLPGTSSYQAILKQHGIDRIDWSTYNFKKPDLLPCKASKKQIERQILKTKLLGKSKFIKSLYKIIC